MQHFVTHDAAGAIVNTCASTLPGEWVMQHWTYPEGGGVALMPAPLDGPAEHYRVGPLAEVLPRDVMTPSVSALEIAADGVAEAVIAGLPVPCVVEVTGAVAAGPVEVTGGVVSITSTEPGALRVRITAGVQWRAWEVVINAA